MKPQPLQALFVVFDNGHDDMVLSAEIAGGRIEGTWIRDKMAVYVDVRDAWHVARALMKGRVVMASREHGPEIIQTGGPNYRMVIP